MNETILEVEGMTCGSCVRTIRELLAPIDGITNTAVDLTNGRVTVVHDPTRTPVQCLIEALASGGFIAKPVEDDHACCAMG